MTLQNVDHYKFDWLAFLGGTIGSIIITGVVSYMLSDAIVASPTHMWPIFVAVYILSIISANISSNIAFVPAQKRSVLFGANFGFFVGIALGLGVSILFS